MTAMISGEWQAQRRADVAALSIGRHMDPFAVLGPHLIGERWWLHAYVQGATRVEAVFDSVLDQSPPASADEALVVELGRFEDSALFHAAVPANRAYRLRLHWPDGTVETVADAYRYGLLLGDLDLHLLAEGRHQEVGHTLGAQIVTIDGVAGVRFAVWAPNAQHVSVVGDFNRWDGTRHPMRLRHGAGVWELFIAPVVPGSRYKYRIVDAYGQVGVDRADPVALATELSPGTASVVADPRPLMWTDEAWLRRREGADPLTSPMSIYEVHAESWLKLDSEHQQGWDLLTERLIPYVKRMGFTHVELLPIMEHPFRGSWGYQPLGQYAPTARLGSPRKFGTFVDRCHEAGIGVILDWVPGHFPDDPHGLSRFDGTSLYEYADPREGYHRDWHTMIYNLGRHEVRGFMIGSALNWIERYHVDGLRVDAVASMLYRDYSRQPGEWLPNRYGGRENLEVIDFLRELNRVINERHPGVMTIAEESTAWPGVSASVADGGLGFGFKWNMGWMHDTLRYLSQDPIHRRWHHHDMTFSMIYAYSEHFVLPLSHDEVVHGKGSLWGKMPGDAWQKAAGLRAYFGFMWSHPGKKLLFMGGEIGQPSEWNHDTQIDWDQLGDPAHAGIQKLVADLNHLYVELPALHAADHKAAGFTWLIGDDAANSVFAFLRWSGVDGDAPVLVVSNLTPVPRLDYRLGVPWAGRWRELINTDAAVYGGSNLGNDGVAVTRGGEHSGEAPMHGQPQWLSLTLPPLATLILRPESN